MSSQKFDIFQQFDDLCNTNILEKFGASARLESCVGESVAFEEVLDLGFNKKKKSDTKKTKSTASSTTSNKQSNNKSKPRSKKAGQSESVQVIAHKAVPDAAGINEVSNLKSQATTSQMRSDEAINSASLNSNKKSAVDKLLMELELVNEPSEETSSASASAVADNNSSGASSTRWRSLRLQKQAELSTTSTANRCDSWNISSLTTQGTGSSRRNTSGISALSLTPILQTFGVQSLQHLCTTETDTPISGRSRRRRNKRNPAMQVSAPQPEIVDYVDLVSTPIFVQDVINLDSDEETVASTKPTPPTTFTDENPLITLKVLWGGKYERFPIRKYQKFSNIFKELADRENLDVKSLMFNYNDTIINDFDTPMTIDYNPFQHICGRALQKKIDTAPSVPVKNKLKPDEILLKIQSNKFKHPFKIIIKKTDTFKILYIKCSEEANIPCKNIKLSFDGEPLEYNETPLDLDLANNEMVDMRISEPL